MFRILAIALWLIAALVVIGLLPVQFSTGRFGTESLAVGAILIVLGWSLIEIAIKTWRVWKEHKSVSGFGALFSQIELGYYTPKPYSLKDSRAVRRANHISECAKPDISKLHEAIPAVASLDASILTGSYGALNVYAWSLPVIGFMGTAAGMAQAIGGFKDALAQTQGDLNHLVTTLGNSVIPGLAGAFGITILALAASLVVHLCTSALRDWDQEALTKLDRLCIVMLSRIPLPEGPEGAKIVAVLTAIANLLTELFGLPSAVDSAANRIATASEHLLAASREMQTAASAPYVVTIERAARNVAASSGNSGDAKNRESRT